MNKKLIEFNSGLRLIVCENTSVRSLSMGVFVGAGVITEKKNEPGISHFIEHMVFKGTEKRTSFDIVNEMDEIGANINAATAKSFTYFYTESLDEHVEKCMDILSDMYFNPKFDSKDLKKERKVVIEEIHESEDDPFDVLMGNGTKLSCGGSQFENEILGTKASLMAMDSDMLKGYHSRLYVPSNTVISIAGNISPEKAEKLVNKYFESKMQKSEKVTVDYPAAPYVSASVKKKKDIAQSHMAFYFPDKLSQGDEKGREVLGVLSLILDGGMSSRLFQNIREKLGVCYSVGCMRSSYKNNGRVVIYTSTSPDKVEKTVSAIRHELDVLKEKGVTEEELSKAKEQVKTAFVLAEERTRSVMNTFGQKAIMEDKLYNPDERLKIIDSITKKEVDEMAIQVFDYDCLVTSLVSKDTKPDILKLFKK